MRLPTIPKSFRRFLIAATVALLGAGCTVYARPAPMARVVVVPAGHVHTARCGHYFYRGRWYLLAGHHHHRGCGHVLVRGVWVLR